MSHKSSMASRLGVSSNSASHGRKNGVAGSAKKDNSKRFHARMREQREKEEQHEHDDNDDDDDEMEEEEDEFIPATAPRSITLDMIATSTSHSANKKQPTVQRTPKNTPRPEVSKKRKREQEEEDNDGEERTQSTKSSASFTTTPSATATAASSSSGSAAARASSTATPAFAPAATGVGALFSEVTPALDPDILHVLEKSFGFSRMTPVQQQTIPTFLKKDVAVQSYTGSGKTLSFVLPMLQILLNKFTSPSSGELEIEPHTVAAIILSPTRELATQICSVIAPFVHGGSHASSRLSKFRLAEFIGGTSMSTVELDFVKHGGNIVIATPGRLNSTMGKLPGFHVRDLRVLILDEADRLLDEGFEKDITEILRKLPKQRRTGLFSATQTRQVKELRRAGLQEKFAKIDVLLEWKKAGGKKDESNASSAPTGRTQMTPTTLKNFYSIIKAENKLSALVDFLCKHSHEKVIIFFLTGDQVEYFSRLLPRLKALYSRSLHKKIYALRGGKQGMDQGKRNAQFEGFVKEKSGGILIATDVAARGIDVPDVDWIVQYDPPKDPSVFVHRIGRTARMGKTGSAIVYLTPEERPYIDLIENLNVPMEHEILSEEAFEPHHSWKQDPDISGLVKLMEEGKATSQIFESIRKKHGQALSEKKVVAPASESGTATDSTTAATTSSPSTSIGSIRSVLREVKYLSLEDRFLMEKAQRAYTSFIDGYKQHIMQHALSFQKLPFGDVAQGMGLLFLPKMPDIKHLTQSIRYDKVPLKAHFIRFKDPKLQAEHEKKEAAIHEKNQLEQSEREAKWLARQKKLEQAGPKRKKKQSQLIRDEWEELQNENRLLKKLKQGKISKKDFEIAVGERKKNGKEKTKLSGSDEDDDSDGDMSDEDESGDSDVDISDNDDDEAPQKKKPKLGQNTPTANNSKKQSQGKQSMNKQQKGKLNGKRVAKQEDSSASDDDSDAMSDVDEE